MVTFGSYKQFVDDASDAAGHTLNTATGLSEKSIAGLVLLLSTIPEYYGLVGATGNRAVSIAAALISLALVKSALGYQGERSKWVPVNHFWLIYAAVLAAEIAFIVGSGAYLDIGLVVFSFGGAVCSEQIATVIKAEMQAAATVDLQAAKDAIKLDEMRTKSEVRTAAYVAKHAPEATEDGHLVANGDSAKTVMTDEKLRESGQKGRETRQGKAQARQDDLYERLVADYPGVDLRDIKYSEIASLMSVSANTAKRDIQALRDGGRINGQVPEGA